MTQQHTEKHTIWITGASSGIGLALAKALSRQGHTVFISARNKDTLEKIAKDNNNIIAIPFDITCQEQIPQVQKTLLERTQILNKVFINAGNCEYLDISTPDWNMMKRIMDVNFLGAVNTLAVALPLLKNQAEKHIKGQSSNPENRPQIIGISSLVTLLAFSRAEAYGASKAAMNYFLQSLALDLKPYNIAVTTVWPGFVKTPLTDKNTFNMPFIISPENAAQRIIKGICSRPRTLAFPKRLYWTLKLLSFFPGIWQAIMSPKAIKLPEPDKVEPNRTK